MEMVKLGKAKLPASWSEVEGDGERARELGGTMAAGGSASALLASGRSEGGGRARAEGSRASSTSRRPACGTVRPSQARSGHAAATFWPRSAMTGLKLRFRFAFQVSTVPTDRQSLTLIHS